MKQIPSAIYLVPALPLLMIVSGVVLIAMAPRSTSNTEAIQRDPPIATLSQQAAIIATVNAAPFRPARASAGLSDGLASLGIDPASVTAGEANFSSICAACHGFDARGLTGLGKDLLTSEFVASTSNDDLLTFIKTGRPIWDPANTTGIEMPAKGGNPALTDEDIVNIIYYLRSLTPDYVPSEADVAALSPESAAEPTAVQPEAAAQTASQVVSAAGDQSEGASLFIASCSSCHGLDARGLPYLGKDLVTSEFVASTSDDDLLAFIKTGRPIWDPANTTGVAMPPKGDNPTLSDEDILTIIGYLRSIAE